MNVDKLESSITACDEAMGQLAEAIGFLDGLKGAADDAEHGIASDAVIKRFEVAFEYTWKLMKAAAEYQGSEAFGPRPAIQEAIRYEWIDDPEFWAAALDARNGSVHDYFGITRKAYIEIVKEFVAKTKKLLKKIKAIVPK
ncbi:MAG: HI0074 family nucleotidyltransferase substrate-binding subunit [Pseudomonadota bacterium]